MPLLPAASQPASIHRHSYPALCLSRGGRCGAGRYASSVCGDNEDECVSATYTLEGRLATVGGNGGSNERQRRQTFRTGPACGTKGALGAAAALLKKQTRRPTKKDRKGSLSLSPIGSVGRPFDILHYYYYTGQTQNTPWRHDMCATGQVPADADSHLACLPEWPARCRRPSLLYRLETPGGICVEPARFAYYYYSTL